MTISASTSWSLANGADLASRNRHNLFDPIFGYDEIDAHTVSAAAQTLNSNSQRQTEVRSAPQPNKPQLFNNNDDDYQPPPRVSIQKPVDGVTIHQIINDKRAPTSPSSPDTQRPLPTPSFSVPLESSRATRRASTEEPRHWSALENYYQKLRQSALSNLQPALADNYQPVYQVIQQQEADDSLSAYRPLNTYSAPYSSSGTINSLLSNSQQSAAKPPAFLLQLLGSSRPPNSDPDFGFSVHHNAAPGISRTGGSTGPVSVIWSPQSSPAAQIDRSAAASPYDFQVKGSSRAPSSPLPVSLTPANIGGQYHSASQQDDSNRASNLEWRKLPELLLIQQQQQRIKHQQETFGDWYDHQRSRELLQEEAFCGPRNYLANLVEINQPDVKSGLLPSLEPNEYPSHMGVYNGSTADSNYLCAATWIHDQFALTLASCLKGMDVNRLVVRAGEWNLNKNSTANEQPAITRQVEQVSVFPRYRSNSTDHDLALLKFAKPLDYLEVARLCPACQVQSRSSIRANSCWAPIRNMTVTEYFDADGDGETKERKSVRMVDLPVKLITNDNNECFRQTKMEFFNFQHPNYICSADFRGSIWRARLNQTDYFGSGIYCNEGGNLSLVSILHPIHSNSSSAYGFLDLSYYRPWMRNVISGRSY